MVLDYKYEVVRSAAILTNNYVAGTVLSNLDDKNQLIVLIDFTKGSLTSASVKVEFSPDGTNYYQETGSSVAAGTSTESLLEHTMSATGAYRLAIQLKDRFVKISAKGTGTVDDSSLTIKAVTGRSS
jgi:hypothetical protein